MLTWTNLKDKNADDFNGINRDNSKRVNSEENLDIENPECEDDDEKKVIYQRILENYEKRKLTEK